MNRSSTTDRPWPVRTLQIDIGDQKIHIDVIEEFDAVLNDFAREAPDDIDQIPYFADIWPSAIALAQYLSCHPAVVRNKHVIELGCGLGLPAIVAAKQGATSVTATDFHPACIPYCQANAIKNDVRHIQCHTLDWRNPQTQQTFDCIIGSDLLYEQHQIHALIGCANRISKPHAQIILADPLRQHIESAVEQLQQTGWEIQLHPQQEILIIIATRSSK